MKTWNLEKILPLALECGAIALRHYDHPQRFFKADHSVVTAADHAIEDRLHLEFDHPDQGSYLLGEETIDKKTEAYLEAAFAHTAWVIDPIDGTAPFANNLPTWGVSIGFMEQGILKEGLIFLAALGELYYTHHGQVFRQLLGTDPQRWQLGAGQALPKPEPVIAEGTMIALSQYLARNGHYQLPFYIQVTGSSVFSMAKLAAGSYGAHVTRFRLWDFAAGLPMLKNLGFTCEYYGGGDMTCVMDESNIVRDRDSAQRWTCRDQVIFAPSPEMAELVRRGLTP